LGSSLLAVSAGVKIEGQPGNHDDKPVELKNTPQNSSDKHEVITESSVVSKNLDSITSNVISLIKK